MELRDIGGALWRQRLLVLLILAITALAVALGLKVAPKTYTATATLAATGDPSVPATDDLNSLRRTLAELANSREVVADVQRVLPVRRSTADLVESVRGEWIRNTVQVEITVTDSDPDAAAQIANAVADVLPLHDPNNRVFLYTTSSPAVAPATYSSPDILLVIGAGAVVAVVVVLGAALLRDRRTKFVDGAAAVEEVAGAPLLAHVWPPEDPTMLPALDPGTAAADVFRHLRIALDVDDPDAPRVVVVAGVTAGDVNVWLGANLAIALADAGHRVLLVDGRIGERHGPPLAGEPDTPGLSDVLRGADLVDSLSPGPANRLTVLPSGTAGPQPPGELIEAHFATVMARARADFDVIVVLGPSLDSGEDTRLMAAGGSFLLAVPDGVVAVPTLRRYAHGLRARGTQLRGVVLVSPTPQPQRVLA